MTETSTSIYDELDAAISLLDTTMEDISPTKSDYKSKDDDGMSDELSNLETSILSLQEELHVSFSTEHERTDRDDDDDLSQEIHEMETSILSLRAELSETASQASFPQMIFDDESTVRHIDESGSQASTDSVGVPKASEGNISTFLSPDEKYRTDTITPRTSNAVSVKKKPPQMKSTPIHPLSSMPVNSPDLFDFCFEDGEQQSPSPIRHSSPGTVHEDARNSITPVDLSIECEKRNSSLDKIPPQIVHEIPTIAAEESAPIPQDPPETRIPTVFKSQSAPLKTRPMKGKKANKRSLLSMPRIFAFGRKSKKQSKLKDTKVVAASPQLSSQGIHGNSQESAIEPIDTAPSRNANTEQVRQPVLQTVVTKESIENKTPLQGTGAELYGNKSIGRSRRRRLQSTLEVVNEQHELPPPVASVFVKDATDVSQMDLKEIFESIITTENAPDTDGILGPPKEAMKKIIRMLGKERKRNQKLERQNKKLLKMISDAWRDKQKMREIHAAKAKEVIEKTQNEINDALQKYGLEREAKESLMQEVEKLKSFIQSTNQHILKSRNGPGRQLTSPLVNRNSVKGAFLSPSKRGPRRINDRYPTKIPSPRDSPMARFPTKIPSPHSASRGVSTPNASQQLDKENSRSFQFTPNSRRRRGNFSQQRSPAPANISTGYTRTMR